MQDKKEIRAHRPKSARNHARKHDRIVSHDQKFWNECLFIIASVTLCVASVYIMAALYMAGVL